MSADCNHRQHRGLVALARQQTLGEEIANSLSHGVGLVAAVVGTPVLIVFTVSSAFFIPLTFIVGIYGMNFDSKDGGYWLNMPELQSRYGYVCLCLVMISVVVSMFLFFRRKKWL